MSWLEDRLTDLIYANVLRNSITIEEWDGERAWAQARAAVPNLSFRGLDNRYYICPRADFLRCTGDPWRSRVAYMAEKYDCEDFAIAFRAQMVNYYGLNGVGIIVDDSAAHAYNLILFTDAPPEFFEPNGQVFVAPGYGLYLAQQGQLWL